MSEVEACLDRDLWLDAIRREAASVQPTFKPVRRPDHDPVIDTVWVFKVKGKPDDGKVDKFKARLTIRGFNMRRGLNYLETHAPTMMHSSIRLLVAEAAARRAAGSTADLYSADISSAFTYGKFEKDEKVYVENFENSGIATAEHEVLFLLGCLYGCKNSARAFFIQLRNFLLSIGFYQSTADGCVYVSKDSSMFLGTHVDDLIIFATSEQYEWFCDQLGQRFKHTADGIVETVLGMKIHRPTRYEYHLSQETYIDNFLSRFGYSECRPYYTPCDRGALLDVESTKDSESADITEMREKLGAINYLVTMTRPDLQYGLARLQEHMHAPKLEHIQAANLLLRHIRTTKAYPLAYDGREADHAELQDSVATNEWIGTKHDGTQLKCLVHCWTPRMRDLPDLTVFSDSDWAGDKGTRKSMLPGVVIVCGAVVASFARKSKLVCLSSCEAELDAAVQTMRLAMDIAGLQAQLRSPPCQWPASRLSMGIPLRIDNQPAIAAIASDSRGRNRHFDIRLQFLRHNISTTDFTISYIATDDNPADGGTKALDRTKQAVSARRLLGKSAATTKMA